MYVIYLRFQSFVLKKSNMKFIEISSKPVIKSHKIFVISKDAIENSSTCVGKVRIRLSVQVSVM